MTRASPSASSPHSAKWRPYNNVALGVWWVIRYTRRAGCVDREVHCVTDKPLACKTERQALGVARRLNGDWEAGHAS